MAVSGGSTAPLLFGALTGRDKSALALTKADWGRVGVWQVDERVAPDGDVDRNAGQLAVLSARLHLMPVGDNDLDVAAVDYAADLPESFDVVHLGVGSDGHTASWIPFPHPDASRVLDSSAAVLTVGEYQGRQRMTLGRSVVNRARSRVVLATGASKAPAIAQWVAGVSERGESWLDPALPVAALDPENTYLFLDEAAASDLDRRGHRLRGFDAPPGE